MILGLDISTTSTGLLLLSPTGNVIFAEAIVPDPGRKKKLTVIERGIIIAQRIAQIVQARDPDRIVIEDYGFASQSLAPQAEVKGIVLAVLHQMGRKWVLVSPNALKKFAGGKQKEDVRLEVYKRWGFEHASNDVVDAYVLARIGSGLQYGTTKLTQPQQAVVAKIKESL